MKPYYESRDGRIVLYHGEALETLRSLPDRSVNLIATDPPYFRVKGEWWDRQWDKPEGFLDWLGVLCDEWRRVLAPNGSLYVFASPDMASKVERVVGERFNVLNSIRWLKEEGWHQKAEKEALRSFLSPWEGIIFAEQYGCEYEDASLALHKKVYAPIGRAVAERRIAARLARHEIDTACSPSRKPTGLCYRWEEGACLPTLDQWVALCRRCGDGREYEALRREYEALRRPFSLSDRAEWSDIWRFDTVPAYPGKHPCEKPLPLMSHVLAASSNPGDVVLDCFAGFGTTLRAAKYLDRRAIGIEIEERNCRVAVAKLGQEALPLFDDEAVA